MSADQDLADRLRDMATTAQHEGAEWVAISPELLFAIADVLDPDDFYADDPEFDGRFN